MKISIPQPCHENWNEMLPEEKGRFCLSCQKCVCDFTKMSDSEIINYSKQKDVCIKVNRNQIDRINQNHNSIYPKWFRYSSLLVAFGLSSIGFGQNNSELKYTTSDIENLIKKDTVVILKLQVVDDFEGSPISGAKVYLDKKKRKISTITDENGYFELEIPTKYLNDFIIVESEYLNRDYQIKYILNQDKIGNEIYLGQVYFEKSKPNSLIDSIFKFFV